MTAPWLAAVALMGVTGAAPQAASRAQAATPNILMFLVDDMGWMDSTPYGSTYYETPHMERFASQAMRFTDAYALPTCSPTRASILTGQHASRHGVTYSMGHKDPPEGGFQPFIENVEDFMPLRFPHTKNYLDPAQFTIAEALQGAGYRTGFYGKWHLGSTQPHWPSVHGFDVAWHSEPSAGPPGYYFSPYHVFPPDQAPPPGKYPKFGLGTITDGPRGEYITDRLTDEAIAFIEECGDQPFFLNMWHFGVHGPWGHKKDYTEAFMGKVDPSGRQGNPIMASMLRSIDESLGRVMDALEERGIADNTIFVFYSDNGGNVHSNLPGARREARLLRGGRKTIEAYQKWAGDLPPTSNLPLRKGKGALYEGGQRVPLMVRWPGKVAPGSTTDAIVGPIDFYPTFLQVANLAPPVDQILDGQSLLPVLTGVKTEKPNVFYSWSPHGNAGASVRQGDWKLIRRLRPFHDFPGLRELYNLRDDIGESNNVAKAFPDRARELDAMLDTFLKDTGALYPPPNPRYLGLGMRPSARGLISDQCRMTPLDDGVRLEARGADALLSLAVENSERPMIMSLRIRSERGGSPVATWWDCEHPDPTRPTASASFDVPAAAGWHDVRVSIPCEARVNTVRLQFPLPGSPWEIQAIDFLDAESMESRHRWNLAD